MSVDLLGHESQRHSIHSTKVYKKKYRRKTRDVIVSSVVTRNVFTTVVSFDSACACVAWHVWGCGAIVYCIRGFLQDSFHGGAEMRKESGFLYQTNTIICLRSI